MNEQINQFESLWSQFITALRGRLISLSSANSLNYEEAKSVLSRQAQCWQDDFTAEGRWLAQLNKSDGEKGRRIRKILSDDIKFEQIATPSKSNLLTLGTAVGGGAIGYGIASVANMGTAATIAVTAIPLIAGGIVGSNIAHRQYGKSVKETVTAYCDQLDKYRSAVISILMA